LLQGQDNCNEFNMIMFYVHWEINIHGCRQLTARDGESSVIGRPNCPSPSCSKRRRRFRPALGRTVENLLCIDPAEYHQPDSNLPASHTSHHLRPYGWDLFMQHSLFHVHLHYESQLRSMAACMRICMVCIRIRESISW
jgi:hypothetical protein